MVLNEIKWWPMCSQVSFEPYTNSFSAALSTQENKIKLIFWISEKCRNVLNKFSIWHWEKLWIIPLFIRKTLKNIWNTTLDLNLYKNKILKSISKAGNVKDKNHGISSNLITLYLSSTRSQHSVIQRSHIFFPHSVHTENTQPMLLTKWLYHKSCKTQKSCYHPQPLSRGQYPS